MSAAAAALATWLADLSWTEVVGAVTGLWCVWLYGRESLWAWPIAIVNALAFMVTFHQARLYADVVLQVVFFALSVRGWYLWVRGGPDRSALRISTGVSASGAFAFAAAVGVVAAAAGAYFARYTGAALPYWDSTILALSLGAQWLLNRKQLENWYVWILVDVMAVGVFSYRGLILTAILYVVFFGLAIRGAVAWRRLVREAGPVERPAAA